MKLCILKLYFPSQTNFNLLYKITFRQQNAFSYGNLFKSSGLFHIFLLQIFKIMPINNYFHVTFFNWNKLFRNFFLKLNFNLQ